jgi:hypothetical protein
VSQSSRRCHVTNELIASGILPRSYIFLSRIDGATIADLATAIGLGHLDLAGWTKLLDDTSKYTTSVVVRLLLSPLSPQVANWGADATESFVELALPAARASTDGLFQDLYGDPVRKTIIDQWITAQNRRLANAQPIQTLQQMFGVQTLADAGFRPGFLDQNAQDTAWFNSVVGSPNGDSNKGGWSLKVLNSNAHLVVLGSGYRDSGPSGSASAYTSARTSRDFPHLYAGGTVALAF